MEHLARHVRRAWVHYWRGKKETTPGMLRSYDELTPVEQGAAQAVAQEMAEVFSKMEIQSVQTREQAAIQALHAALNGVAEAVVEQNANHLHEAMGNALMALGLGMQCYPRLKLEISPHFKEDALQMAATWLAKGKEMLQQEHEKARERGQYAAPENWHA